MVNEQQHIDTIITGCRKGDRKAQEQLYKSYYKAMMTICLRYTQQEEDAVEMLNNGFLKVFKNIERFDPAKAGLYTWIRTIVINSCLDFIKAKQRIETHSELDEAVSVHVPAEVVSKMKNADLLQLIRKLPPATAAVFNLYVLEGYNHKEIGKLVGISEGTSKWHLSEGRKQLQEMIKIHDLSIHE